MPIAQVIGQAFGNAAMILASGKKGYRYALPNARIMTCPPRMNRAFGNVSNCMIKANELENATQVGCGRSVGWWPPSGFLLHSPSRQSDACKSEPTMLDTSTLLSLLPPTLLLPPLPSMLLPLLPTLLLPALHLLVLPLPPGRCC